MQTRRIGNLEVSCLGFGAMPLSLENRPSRDRAIEVIRRAIELGFTHFDSAWAYYLAGGLPQHNEMLIAEAFRGKKDMYNCSFATKVGHNRFLGFNDEPFWDQIGHPSLLKRCAYESRIALGVQSIDLLYNHRPDLNYSYESQLQAMKELADEGVAAQIGLSNVTVDQIKMGQDILDYKLVAVQNQFSPVHPYSYTELEFCAQNNLAFVCWSPLGGYRDAVDESKFDLFKLIAGNHGVSYQQVILRWELSLGSHVIPIPGFRRLETLEDSAKAPELEITREELQSLTDFAIKL